MHGGGARLDAQLEPLALSNARELPAHLLEQRRYGEVARIGADRSRFELADVEQRICQTRHRIDRLTLLGYGFPGHRVAHDAPQRAVEQRKHLQGLAKVVTRSGEKAALGEICSFGGLPSFHELGLNTLALGHVAKRRGDEQALTVANGTQ